LIFARRILQQHLDDLRPTLGDKITADLAKRLNRSGNDRIAAMWEVVVFHALSQFGSLRIEEPLLSRRQPDLAFENDEVAFVADVTSVSDSGLNEQNPFSELSALIEQTKAKLGLETGGMDLRVGSAKEQTKRGTRTVLRIPERKRLAEFVASRIEPPLREQISQGREVLNVVINDDVADLQIAIDPRKSPYNSGGYAAYNTPTILDQNPLYNALRPKARQLKGANGVTGVIVGDADSRALADRPSHWSEVSARAIADEFLRQNSSIGFVLLLSVREEQRSVLRVGPSIRKPHALLAFSKTSPPPTAIEALFRQMMANFPKPVAMPINASARANVAGYGWGFHGGLEMSGRRIKISSRAVVELLAGRKTIEDMNDWHQWSTANEANTMQNPFERLLRQGCLPTSMTVLKGDENEPDDWVEFEFGEPDPAISPFH
jgi:hypothetical protein